MFIRITREGRARYSIRFTVVCVFVLATGLTSALGIFLHWHFSRAMAVEAALGEYQQTATRTTEYLNAIDRSTVQTTRILAGNSALLDGNRAAPPARRLFAEVMEDNPIYYAIYIGFPNGDFYELVNLESSSTVRRQLNAADSDRWVIIRVTGSGDERRRFFDYYDESFNLRITRSERSDYFANRRIWYTGATPDNIYKTAPYMFQHLQAPGQTYSTFVASSDAVLAVDIALSSLSEYLSQVELSSPGDIYLFQEGGEVLASNRYAENTTEIADVHPLLLDDAQRRYLDSVGKIRVSNETNWSPIDFAVAGEPRGYMVELTRLVARMLDMDIEFVNGYNWPELVNKFQRNEFEILQPVFPNEQNRHAGLLSKPILRLPYAVVTAEGVPAISDIRQLMGKTVAIPEGWSVIPLLRQQFPEIQIREVPSTRRALESVANNEVFATLDSGPILRYAADIFFIEGLVFHDINEAGRAGLPDELHFLVSREHPELLELLNLAIDNVQPMQRQALRQKWLERDGPVQDLPANPVVPYEELIQQANDAQRQNHIETIRNPDCDCFTYVAEFDANDKIREYFAVVAPRRQVLAPALNKVTVSLVLILICFALLMPLCWWFASPIVRPIKRLAAENDKVKNRLYDEVGQLDSRILEIYDLSKSIVEMAGAIKRHEMDQQALMDSFIKLIAQAIDEKSPYTGGHCARVPELAIMLATEAGRAQQGIFRDFDFSSEQKKREFSVAAWLHDCGKITTPEHIVDKGTKLETIYNRIHEIRMRFEVLRRDAQIQLLQKSSADAANSEQYEREFQQTCQQLEQDYAFIASLNLGSEFVTDENIKRLHELATLTWTRYFSDRLGLSPVEGMRYQAPESLPVTEPLLADRPEHIFPRLEKRKPDPALRIDMEIPEHLYNLGEIHNLSVSRGTLTAEDRFKINEHMIATIKMLESLSFPPELAKVPKYASTHHETLTGTGYPRKLEAKDLEIPDRILAIADIYEALTAADRPYKKAKPLSEAIQILANMVRDGKLCEETFQLFLSSGVYMEYARRYLAPEQIDEVDMERFLRKPSH